MKDSCLPFFLKAGGINEDDRSFNERYLGSYNTPSDLAVYLRDSKGDPDILNKHHFRLQVSYVCGPDGRLWIDHLINLQNLHFDLPLVLGSRVSCELPYANKGPERSESEKCLTADAVDALREVYEVDFQLLALAKGPISVMGEPVLA